MAEGVFEQVLYQQRPQRHEYLLTAKGRGLLPWFISLLQWGDKWCDPQRMGKPMLVTHEPCGHLLDAQVHCSECQGRLRAHEVRFTRNGQDLADG